MDEPRPEEDTYVRVLGQTREYTENDSEPVNRKTVYFVESSNIPEPAGDNILVNTDGTWFDDADWTEVTGERKTTYFLYQYNATTTDPTTTEVDTQCSFSESAWQGGGQGKGPTKPQHCFYPMAVKAPQGIAGNVPLTTSCLASFNGL